MYPYMVELDARSNLVETEMVRLVKYAAFYPSGGNIRDITLPVLLCSPLATAGKSGIRHTVKGSID